MSNYTIKKSDAEPEDRYFSAGRFSVDKGKTLIAIFMFNYPENQAPVCGTESEALAAAKSFMAIDDLVAALLFYADKKRYKGPNQRLTESDAFTLEGEPYMRDVTRDRGEIAHASLEKAGIK